MDQSPSGSHAINGGRATVDRSRVEALVREALARELGAENAAAREIDSAGALLLAPDRGVNIGEPYDPRVMPGILAATPARVAVGRTGTRYRTNTMLRFRADHAAAKDAVISDVDPALLAELGLFELTSRAPDKATFLQRPDLGRALSDEARVELGRRLGTGTPRGSPSPPATDSAGQSPAPSTRIGRAPTLVVIYGDGLSATALNQHLREFHAALIAALAARGIAHAPPFFVRRSRVKIMDEIARLCGAQAALFVCGERPGLGFADSLSAYYIYQPATGATDADREVISNINPRGRPPAEAARDAAGAIERILREKKSGVILSGA